MVFAAFVQASSTYDTGSLAAVIPVPHLCLRDSGAGSGGQIGSEGEAMVSSMRMGDVNAGASPFASDMERTPAVALGRLALAVGGCEWSGGYERDAEGGGGCRATSSRRCRHEAER